MYLDSDLRFSYDTGRKATGGQHTKLITSRNPLCPDDSQLLPPPPPREKSQKGWAESREEGDRAPTSPVQTGTEGASAPNNTPTHPTQTLTQNLAQEQSNFNMQPLAGPTQTSRKRSLAPTHEAAMLDRQCLNTEGQRGMKTGSTPPPPPLWAGTAAPRHRGTKIDGFRGSGDCTKRCLHTGWGVIGTVCPVSVPCGFWRSLTLPSHQKLVCHCWSCDLHLARRPKEGSLSPGHRDALVGAAALKWLAFPCSKRSPATFAWPIPLAMVLWDSVLCAPRRCLGGSSTFTTTRGGACSGEKCRQSLK